MRVVLKRNEMTYSMELAELKEKVESKLRDVMESEVLAKDRYGYHNYCLYC